MPWVISNPQIGMPLIGTVNATNTWRLGDIVKATHETLGSGEFIWLRGIGGTFAGAVVTYVGSTGLTALGTTSGILTGGAPVAVATAATIVDTYGWYQIAGSVAIYKTAVKFDPASGNRVYLSATAGRIMQTSVAGRQIIGARFDSLTTVTSTTSTANVTLNRPSQKSGTAV